MGLPLLLARGGFMLTYPLSRRQWLGFSALGCGCVLGSSAAFSEAASTLVPVGYTPPQPVTDLTKAPRLQAKLTGGAEGQVRSYAVIFGKGDEIMSGMTAFAQRERLVAAHFTAIGAIESGLFGWFDKQYKAYRNLPVNEQAEVASLVGDIGLVDGKPAVHIHAVVVPKDGIARGGHLLQATVWPTLEVFLTAYPAPLMKELDPATDLDLFELEA
jgi:predicted DNA-binding protein with PD1-like motif